MINKIEKLLIVKPIVLIIATGNASRSVWIAKLMLRVKSPIYESSWEVDQNKLFSVTLHHQTKRLWELIK